MDNKEFRKYAHELVDWMADFLEDIESYPVRSQAEPKDIINQLPESPPAVSESFPEIFADFERIIMPGMTHWQHPSFHAYFPGNASPPSLLAEMLTATLGAQCMIWQTSPAAAELEEQMMSWLRDMLGLPTGFTGVIQDTASTATLCAMLTAREKASDFRVNQQGFYEEPRYTIYCSEQTHSSIEKGVKIAGFGKEHLRKIATDENFALIPDALAKAVADDIAAGYHPLCVIATIGTTSSTACDPVVPITQICQAHNIWLHVDAAFAGTALILPEMKHYTEGFEQIDSFVFNPHKWMFTNFDCSAYFVKDPAMLVRTFEILPEYLKTKEGDQVNDYRDWGIPLGRRFRALKLWFVIRTYGVEGLQKAIRKHISMAKEFGEWITASPNFELLAPVNFNTVCFRLVPSEKMSAEAVDDLNEQLLENLNNSGKIYLTQTRLNSIYTIRIVIGQTNVQQRHVDVARSLIAAEADRLLASLNA